MRDKTHITLDAFEQFIRLPENADRLFELIDGEIFEKMPSELHGFLSVRLVLKIGIFLQSFPLGRLTSETRHQPPTQDEGSFIPDLSFTRTEHLAPLVERGAVPRLPDLAVEIKSPDDSYAKMRRKANYFVEHGTQLVWLVLPERRTVEVYHANGDHAILSEADGGVLDGADVLPGFRLALADVFAGL